MICNEKNCTGCSACANACPTSAIKMVADEEQFLHPRIENNICISCGICKKVCPILNTSSEIKDKPSAFAAFNADKNTRVNSSSGGIFSLLARSILQQDGVVFGSSFDENLSVRHIAIESCDELYKLQGSKYLQSVIGETYKETKKILLEGRPVLFSGTACQIAGLYNYLGKDFKNLYTHDVICHGVPSPMVWKRYLTYLEKIKGAHVKTVSFRNKSSGWKRYSLRYVFENGNEMSIVNSDDLYMKCFLSDIALRPSCYNCKFKSTYRSADITLADFWGIDKVIPEMDDNLGTSLVVIHSQKGQELWHTVKNKVVSKVVDIDEAVKYNPSMIHSANLHSNRDKFMRAVQYKRFDRCLNKYLQGNRKQNFKNFLKSMLRKIMGDDFIDKLKGHFRK